MKNLKFFFSVFILIIILSLTGCLSIPRNDNSGQATAYIKVTGTSKNQSVSINQVLYGFYYIVPSGTNLEINSDLLKVINLDSESAIKQNIKKGKFNEWELVQQTRGTANSNGKYYTRGTITSSVILKENCFTIMPFKIDYEVGKDVEGKSEYVYLNVKFVKLDIIDIAGIMKDLETDENILTYNAVYLGDQDITDKIKGK